MKSVFISSTCYDLIDVRFELFESLTKAGVSVLLSDVANSDFEVKHDRNSIETCLTNVEAADIVIVILSRRYGGSLKRAGYDDLSATHLEYNLASKLGKPIFLYARNRLDAEFNINRKNPEVSLSWISNEKDKRIFEILRNHSILRANDAKSNWYWTFNSSVDLKERVLKDLSDVIGMSLLTSSIHNGRSPIICIKSADVKENKLDYKNYKLNMAVVNAGSSVALNLVSEVWVSKGKGTKVAMRRLGVLLPSSTIDVDIGFRYNRVLESDKGLSVKMEFSYSTELGVRIADLYTVHFNKDQEVWRLVTSEYQKKKFISYKNNYE